MGWFGKLIGTDKAIDNVIDKDNGLLVRAGTAIGNLHYSEQEKAEGQQEVRKWAIDYLTALAPFKIVQRVIAFNVLGVWSFVAVNLVIAIWIRAYYPDIDAVKALWELAISDFIFWPVVSVLSLYMSGGVVRYFSKKGD